MNAQTISRPDEGETRVTSPNSNVAESAFDLFSRLVLESPPLVRITVLLVMGTVMTLCVLRYFGVYPAATIGSGDAYPLANGKEADAPGNKAMSDFTEHIKEDDQHSRWHEEHPEDNPEFKKVLDIGEDNYLGYKFYAKSDHCVFVVRRENGVTISRWLRDPLSQSAAARSTGRDHAANQSPKPSESAFAGLLDGLVPAAEAATPFSLPRHGEAFLEAAGASCVKGTHPGEFTYWWGPAEDQCWTPMFRQWKDGCKHFQRFNRCSNGWDQTIHWVSCAAGPHG